MWVTSDDRTFPMKNGFTMIFPQRLLQTDMQMTTNTDIVLCVCMCLCAHVLCVCTTLRQWAFCSPDRRSLILMCESAVWFGPCLLFSVGVPCANSSHQPSYCVLARCLHHTHPTATAGWDGEHSNGAAPPVVQQTELDQIKSSGDEFSLQLSTKWAADMIMLTVKPSDERL